MSERSFQSSGSGSKISVSKNEKLLISHLKKVSTDDEQTYLDVTAKMANWLVSEKAYYKDAQSYIHLIIQNARNTLWRLNPEKDIDLSKPGPSSLEPRRLAYRRMLETAIPHLQLFVNTECRGSLMDLALQAGFSVREETVDAPVASGSNVTIEQQKNMSSEARHDRHNQFPISKQSITSPESSAVFSSSPAGVHSSVSPLTYTRIKLESTENMLSYPLTQSAPSLSQIQPPMASDNAAPSTPLSSSVPQIQQAQKSLPTMSILTNRANDVPPKVPLNSAPIQPSAVSPFSAPSPAASMTSTSTSASVPSSITRRPMLPGQLSGQKAASSKIVSDSLKRLDLQWFENTKNAVSRVANGLLESTGDRVANISRLEEINRKSREGSAGFFLKPALTINTSVPTLLSSMSKENQGPTTQTMHILEPPVSSFTHSNNHQTPTLSTSSGVQDIPKTAGNVHIEKELSAAALPPKETPVITNPSVVQRSLPVSQTNTPTPFAIPSVGDQTHPLAVLTSITDQHLSNPSSESISDSTLFKIPRESTSVNEDTSMIKQELDAFDQMLKPALTRRNSPASNASNVPTSVQNSDIVGQTPLVSNIPSGAEKQSQINGNSTHGRSVTQPSVNPQTAVLPLSFSPQIQARLSLGPSTSDLITTVVEKQAVSEGDHLFYPPSAPLSSTLSTTLRYNGNRENQDSRDIEMTSQATSASESLPNSTMNGVVLDTVSFSSEAHSTVVESKAPVLDGVSNGYTRVPSKRSFSAGTEELNQRPNSRRRVTEGQTFQTNGYHQSDTLSNGSHYSVPQQTSSSSTSEGLVNNLHVTNGVNAQYNNPPPKPFSLVSFYVPETTVLVYQQRGGKEKSSFDIDFIIEPDLFDFLALWNRRYDHSSDVSKAMCISLACYKMTDKVNVWNTLGEESIKKLVSFLPSRWPKSCGLHARIRFGSLSAPPQAEFGLGHSAVWTVDGFVDISPFIRNEGRLFVTVEHTADMSDYAFILYAHHPTINQLRELAERRNADENWRNLLSQLSRPLTYETFPEFLDRLAT